jgi:glycosyltransferase involved in cell wall biosynthesis
VIAKGVKSERTRILPNWIDTKIFQPQSDPATKASLDSRFPTGKRILHVGRKGVEKNLDTLLEALQHLPPDYSVIFIGRGNVEHYQNLARSLGVYDRTFWIDSVPNHELPVWYSWCDCFCVASRWEGFGVVYIEAAACGAPIVTSNIAPMNAYLSHGVSAHLVSDYENPTALAEAVHRVCEDRDYRAALSAGAVKAGSLFSRETIQPKEAAAYRSLIDNPPQSNASRLAYRIWRAKYSSSRFLEARMPRRVLHRIREVLK